MAYKAPSVKALMSAEIGDERITIIDNKRITIEQADEIRLLIQRGSPRAALDAFVKAFHLHGVEYICKGGDGELIAYYANTGETYGTTLLHNVKTGGTYLTSWGDFVEKNERRYGIK